MSDEEKDLEDAMKEFQEKVDNVHENLDEIMERVDATDDPDMTAYMSGVVFARAAVVADVDAITYLLQCINIYKRVGGKQPSPELLSQFKEMMDRVTGESQSPDGEDKKWLH